MKIKQAIIDKVNNPQCRNRIGTKLKIGEQTVYQHMKANRPNGRLTCMDALEVLSMETGMAVTDICESDDAKVISHSESCNPTVC